MEVLGVYNNTEILEASSSNDVLDSSVSVDPITASGYKMPTKKQRTFAIGNFKAVITKAQYKKLYLLTHLKIISLIMAICKQSVFNLM